MLNGIGGTAPGRSARRKRLFARLASMVLILAIVFVVAPERASAAELPATVTGVTVNVGDVTASQFFLDDAVSFQDDIENDVNAMLTTVYSLVSFSVNCSYDDTNGGIVSGNLNFSISHPAINVSTMTNNARRVEVVSCQSGDVTNAYVMNTGAQNNTSSTVQLWVSRVNQRPAFGAWITLKVYYIFRGTATQAAAGYQTLLATTPTIAVTYGSGSLGVQSLESLLPDLQRIRTGLLDSTTGWLPTMNTNLQTMVTNQITTNSWLNSSYGQTNVANGHLTNIKSNQVQQISNQNTQIANQETQINQLQVIVDYVSNTKAADIVEDANDTFVNNAGALESGQADLENAADASLAAVDFSKVGLISTFSQSVNWWMRCVNFLPSGTGAIWDVLVFGFLIAFVMFILRLVR